MAIFNLYSKRQKKIKGEIPDVYKYDTLPQKLKVQIVHIIKDAIGFDRYIHDTNAQQVYNIIHKTLCKEYGLFKLGNDFSESTEKQVLNFLLLSENVEQNIDVIELTFKSIQQIIGKNFHSYARETEAKLSPDEAIEELNERFKESGIGYAFENGEIIRIDSTYIHNEVVKPTISLLWNKKFQGANEEYMKAHENYCHGKNKECLAECLKAFESTMKIICKEKGWSYNETDTAKKLIQICFQNGLVPTFTQNQFTSLQNLLESGIPTIRNKLGGHGQGQIPQKVDDEMTRYGLNLTGTNIIFLVEQSEIK